MQLIVKAAVLNAEQFKQFAHSLYRSHLHVREQFKRQPWMVALLKANGICSDSFFNTGLKVYVDVEELYDYFSLNSKSINEALSDAKCQIQQHINSDNLRARFRVQYPNYEPQYDFREYPELQNLIDCSEGELKERVVSLIDREPFHAICPKAVYNYLRELQEDELMTSIHMATGW